MESDASADALALVALFEHFGPLYRRHVGEGLPDGVSPARLRLLAYLSDHGPSAMADVSRALGMTAQNLTGLADALEGEGLIRRDPAPKDRRKTLIALTPPAAELVGAGREHHRRMVADVFEALDSKDQKELRRIIGVLIDKLSASR